MSASTLRDICFDCADPARLARFWSRVLGYDFPPPDTDDPADSLCILPLGDGGMRIWFNAVPEPKTVKNRVHIDINTPDHAELDRIMGLGGSKVQEVRGANGELWWTIMADPEGNEFCAFPPKGA
ncbi:MAG: VOC family protein [Chloroflexota bacterium]